MSKVTIPIQSQERTISHMQSEAGKNAEAVTTLDSERSANALMTDEIAQLQDRSQLVELMLQHEIDVRFRCVDGERVEAIAPGVPPAIAYISKDMTRADALQQAVELAAIRSINRQKRLRGK